MDIELKNLKGTKDFLPSEQLVRNKITDILKKNFEKYGYLPLETPMLNYRDLLVYKYDEDAEIVNEIYKLKDQANRDIGLRFDLTVPFCKLIGLNRDLTMPFRRYEIGKVFRNGPVKLGRSREFYQCDVDVVGIDGRYIEAEQMLMVKKIFDELGIDIVIKWNNRKLMRGLLIEVGIKENLIDDVIGLIDRLEKISQKELVYEFSKLNIDETKVNQILEIFSKNLNEYRDLFKNTSNIVLAEAIDECYQLQLVLYKLHLNENVAEFSPKLARGLGIYTNTVFEFFDKQKRISSSLGGGGRYNKIITNFIDDGKQYPAVGLSFGLEPIYCLLAEQEKSSFIDVFNCTNGHTTSMH